MWLLFSANLALIQDGWGGGGDRWQDGQGIKDPCTHMAGMGWQYKMYKSIILVNFISRSKKWNHQLKRIHCKDTPYFWPFCIRVPKGPFLWGLCGAPPAGHANSSSLTFEQNNTANQCLLNDLRGPDFLAVISLGPPSSPVSKLSSCQILRQLESPVLYKPFRNLCKHKKDWHVVRTDPQESFHF